MAHDVFISYSSKDKPTADAVCATLEAGAIRCWIALRDIAPGADWGESIIAAIEGARVMVLVFSAHANASQQIKREVERAVSKGIAIIPLRIEDVVPAKSLEYFLSTPHWLDAFTPPLERHLQYLAAVVRQIIEGSTEAPQRPAPPPLPFYRRREVMKAGAAALALLVAPLAWLVLRPGPPPSFVGKWQATRVAIDVSPKGYIVVPFADLLAAALRSPNAAASFAVTKFGRYTYSISGEDRGKVAISPATLTFTSRLDGKSVAGRYLVYRRSSAGGIVHPAGGQADDSGLLIDGPDWQMDLSGKPASGVIGRWQSRLLDIGYDVYTLELEITATGTYRLRVSRNEDGIFQAENGKWTRRPRIGFPISGNYVFNGPNLVTMASGRSSMSWRRVD